MPRRMHEAGSPARPERTSRRDFIARAIRGTALGMATLGLSTRAARAAPAFAPGAATPHRQGVAPGPVPHGAEPRGLDLPAKDRAAEGRFGLMFKHLPPFAPPDDLLTELAAGVTDPSHAASEVIADDSATIPSGFTFLGQFIDHDLTLDTTPLVEQQVDPDAVRNFRSARYDLDSIYAAPAARDGDRLRLELNADGVLDVPRLGGRAQIGDRRNDENLIICQLHVAFMQFHNSLVDELRVPFEEARRLTRWHYQWVVVHDFLPRVVGQDVVDALLDERGGKKAKVRLDFFKPKNPNNPMLPVEFAAAAYRFGHSMIRRRYTLSKAGFVRDKDVKALVFGEDPGDSSLLAGTLQNLAGARPIPRELLIQWSNLFEVKDVLTGKDGPRPARKIDSHLSFPLGTLPPSALASAINLASLAERNLLRGKRLGLPSGQRVARAMRVQELNNAELGLTDPRWGGEAPLWFYILKEAELPPHNGERLGPVGGRIVAEVLLGLLERDKTSYLSATSDFRPIPPIAPAPGRFTMADLLRLVGAS